MRDLLLPYQVKAKGTAEREVDIYYDQENQRQKRYHDKEKVKKISYKAIDDETGETFKFKIKGDLHSGRALKWKSDLFESEEYRKVNTCETKEGHDPAKALLVSHLCATEFDVKEVLSDFHPNWEHNSWYYDD